VYLIPSPNPVGLGQEVTFVVFNPQVPPSAGLGNNIRYQYTIAVKKPNGNTETLPATGTIVSDPTGAAWIAYVPDQLGNYSLTVKFLKLQYLWNSTTGGSNDYYGTTFKESTYTTTLVVQQEQVKPTGWTTVPLPTEYWTRPIEGQNTEWYRVSSNWLSNAHDEGNGGDQNRYQQDGTAPNSGHILWTKVTEDGGVVGGGNFSVPGEVFNAGHQYQTRFTSQIIMWGRLYYQGPRYWSGTGEIFTCVDLRTGETLWETNTTGIGAPSFGYYYDWDDPNQHGVVNPGMLFTSNFAREYHPRYGEVTTLNITNVPSGFELVGPQGEVLRYVLSNIGNATNQNYYLQQWNSSKVFTSQSSGTINASLASRYDWNVSAPWRNNMLGGSITTRAVIYNDVLLGSNGTHPTGSGSPSYAYPENVTFWAVSLKTQSLGQLLWMKTITTATTDNQNQIFVRAAEGVFVFVVTPTCKFVGYSMYTGEKLWETLPESDFNPFGYYTWPSLISVEGTCIAYGKLFTSGYSGRVVCYDLYNGTRLWIYDAPTGMAVYPYYTLMLGAVSDGKLYVGTHEHSANTPLFKGNKIRCLNVSTGKEVWTMYGWAHPQTMAIADGILIYWNNYDHQIYAVGKGPSATAVQAPLTAITMGDSVVIQGRVTDISAGTKQAEQAARFPNGVPAVSEASMSAWMEYVYMQKPFPTNATGVQVSIDAIDPNGNSIHLATVTSDATGLFHYTWKTPDIPGDYTVTATFAGSEGYWPSYAETAMYVSETPPTPTPTPAAAPLPPYETYILLATVAIIIAIAIVGILLLRKRA
jgi:outer membrane protein assembly factor BamB